jgi:O-antigen/teichoic acid export membrane protein
LRLVIVAALFQFGSGLSGAAFAYGLPNGACAIVLLVLVLSYVREIDSRGQATSNSAVGPSKLARTFWRFSAPRAFASVCAMTLVWIDVLFVGAYLSAKQAGIYAIASRYLALITFSLAAAGNTLAPIISKLRAEKRHEDLMRLYQTSTAWVMVIAWPACLLLAAFSPVFMGFFGHGFREGASALSVLSLMMLYVTATGTNTVMLVMSGSSSASLGIGALTLLVNIISNIELIPRLGIIGAAWSWAISLFVANVAINVLLYRRFALHPFSRGWYRTAIISTMSFGVIGLVFRLAIGPRFMGLLATVLTGGVLYLGWLIRTRKTLHLDVFEALRPGVSPHITSGPIER